VNYNEISNLKLSVLQHKNSGVLDKYSVNFNIFYRCLLYEMANKFQVSLKRSLSASEVDDFLSFEFCSS